LACESKDLDGTHPVQVQSPPNRSSSTIKTDFFRVPLANLAAVSPAEPPPTTTMSYEESATNGPSSSPLEERAITLFRPNRLLPIALGSFVLVKILVFGRSASTVKNEVDETLDGNLL
jgi:hypothetical protein